MSFYYVSSVQLPWFLLISSLMNGSRWPVSACLNQEMSGSPRRPGGFLNKGFVSNYIHLMPDHENPTVYWLTWYADIEHHSTCLSIFKQWRKKNCPCHVHSRSGRWHCQAQKVLSSVVRKWWTRQATHWKCHQGCHWGWDPVRLF